MPRFADHLTDVSDILGSTVSAGEVFCSVGDSTDGDGWGASAATWGPDGYIAVPNDRDTNGACRAIYLVDGNTQRIVGTRDNRIASRAGTLAAGDRAIVTNGAQRLRVLRSTGQVELYNEDGSGNPIRVLLTSSNNQILIQNGSSTTISMTAGVLTASAGGTTITVNAAGNVTISLAAAATMAITDGVSTLPVALMSGSTPIPSTRFFASA